MADRIVRHGSLLGEVPEGSTVRATLESLRSTGGTQYACYPVGADDQLRPRLENRPFVARVIAAGQLTAVKTRWRE
jgi:hypothetical protein